MPRQPKWRMFTLVLAIGLTLPFLTLLWAQRIGGALIWRRNFPDAILMGFNLIPFLLLGLLTLRALREMAITDLTACFVRKCAVIGGLLALVSLSIHHHMHYWLSTSSTTGLMFLFYLPIPFPDPRWLAANVYVATLSGFGIGWLLGKVERKLWQRTRGLAYGVNIALLAGVGTLNVVASNYGKFNLPAEPGVSAGEALFLKSTFLDTPREVGTVVAMQPTQCSTDFPRTFTIIGTEGAALVSPDGTIQSVVKFNKPWMARPNIAVDADADGFCEFVRGAAGYQPVALIDHRGDKVWSYGNKSLDPDAIEAGASPKDIIPFDIDGDGKLEFLVPLRGTTTAVLDIHGNVKKKIFWLRLQNAATADVNGDGIEELICVNCEREEQRKERCAIEIRGRNLDLLQAWPIPPPPQTYPPPKIFITRWPAADSAWHALINYKQSIKVINLNNGELAHTIPLNVEYDAKFIPVHFASPRAPYLAVANRENRRITLSIYDPSNKLLYQEILRGGVHLMALSLEDGAEVLLVSECGENRDGSKVCGKVWQYALNR
jgi:hypothetical protein